LERMLAWDPGARPPAAEAEGLLLDVADTLPGASLRSWARRVVPDVLAQRPEAPDSAGLLGQTIEIDENNATAPRVEGPLAPAVADATDVPHPDASATGGDAEAGAIDVPRRLDKSRETSHTVSTSRAVPAVASASVPSPVPSPRATPASSAASALRGSSPLPVWTIAAGAAGGLVAGLVVVICAALLLLR
ncbi:MAG: hypothetical protein VX000_16300, partial [Myxococcota bacterium]|nr:hypothetical protein [Myxococcota bacterium]